MIDPCLRFTCACVGIAEAVAKDALQQQFNGLGYGGPVWWPDQRVLIRRACWMEV